MPVALTGATGFAGQAIMRALVAAGHHPSYLLRDVSMQFSEPRLRPVPGDLHDTAALDSLMQGADTVIHVAGAVSARNAAAFFRTNLEGTRNVVAAAKRCGVKRFIHLSSLAARQPQLSPYAASKEAAEHVVHAQSNAMSTLILRPSAVYGPGDRATLPLLAELMKNTATIPGTSNARFSLIHVDDFAAIVAAAVSSVTTGTVEVDDMDGPHNWNQLATVTRNAYSRPHRIFYVPKTAAMAVGKIVETLSGWRGQTAMVTTGKMRELYFPDWIAQAPGWPRQSPVRLASGLVQTFEWYSKGGWLRKAVAMGA